MVGASNIITIRLRAGHFKSVAIASIGKGRARRASLVDHDAIANGGANEQAIRVG